MSSWRLISCVAEIADLSPSLAVESTSSLLEDSRLPRSSITPTDPRQLRSHASSAARSSVSLRTCCSVLPLADSLPLRRRRPRLHRRPWSHSQSSPQITGQIRHPCQDGSSCLPPLCSLADFDLSTSHRPTVAKSFSPKTRSRICRLSSLLARRVRRLWVRRRGGSRRRARGRRRSFELECKDWRTRSAAVYH